MSGIKYTTSLSTMGAAHTPGSWVIPNGSPPIVIAPGKADICVMSGAASNESVMADARLIAAAPDMLAALQRAEIALRFSAEMMPSEAMWGDHKLVVDAINKATKGTT